LRTELLALLNGGLATGRVYPERFGLSGHLKTWHLVKRVSLLSDLLGFLQISRSRALQTRRLTLLSLLARLHLVKLRIGELRVRSLPSKELSVDARDLMGVWRESMVLPRVYNQGQLLVLRLLLDCLSFTALSTISQLDLNGSVQIRLLLLLASRCLHFHTSIVARLLHILA